MIKGLEIIKNGGEPLRIGADDGLLLVMFNHVDNDKVTVSDLYATVTEYATGDRYLYASEPLNQGDIYEVTYSEFNAQSSPIKLLHKGDKPISRPIKQDFIEPEYPTCSIDYKGYKSLKGFEWEVWNEPFGQAQEYAEMFYRTARAIRAVQPSAKIYCTAIAANTISDRNYPVLLEKLKKENALDLGSYFIYHPYQPNPDETYAKIAEPLRKLVKSYSGSFDIMQGEVGCPAQLEFGHALNGIEWTEYSQAKWNLRRTIGDAVRAIPCNVFTMIDLQYTFMLQSFGMLRSNALKEVVYRRPSYYAMQNVFSYLDDEALPYGVVTNAGFTITRRADPRDKSERRLTCARFTRFGNATRFYWFSDQAPSNRLEFDRVTIEVPGQLDRPVWVEMITGRIFEIPAANVRQSKDGTILTDVPMWDSPVMIADHVCVPRR